MKPFAIVAVCVAGLPVLAATPVAAQIHRTHTVVTHRIVTHNVVHRPTYRPAYHRPIVHRSRHCGYRWVNHHRVRRCWVG